MASPLVALPFLQKTKQLVNKFRPIQVAACNLHHLSLHNNNKQQQEHVISQDSDLNSQLRALLSEREEELYASAESIKIFSNQLAANRPLEDRWGAYRLHLGVPSGGYDVERARHSPLLLGVVDGHNGPACANTVNTRLPDYLAVALMNQSELDCAYDLYLQDEHLRFSSPLRAQDEATCLNNVDMEETHNKQLRDYLVRTKKTLEQQLPLHQRIPDCLLQLDDDICSAVKLGKCAGSNFMLSKNLLRSAISGCVGTFCIFNGPSDLWVSHVGDCSAVIGSKFNGVWETHKLTEDHHANNPFEVNRLKSNHPVNEHDFLLANDRLLGELMPLRAFGNIRFKWHGSELTALAKRLNLPKTHRPTPFHYQSPPYLHAIPDITHRQLSVFDKFLIVASDGLWDLMTQSDAVDIIGELLDDGCQEENLATCLIKAALSAYRPGSGPPNMDLMTQLLTLPPRSVRYYRDDITVSVALLHQ